MQLDAETRYAVVTAGKCHFDCYGGLQPTIGPESANLQYRVYGTEGKSAFNQQL